MKNKNWKNEFPEVPEHVHQTVLDTLAGLDERKVKKVKKMKKGKIIVLIAAAVAVLGMTVSASEIFQWNRRAAEVFMSDEEQQKELVTEQIAKEEYQTISDAGLTIRAIQTIQDNNCFYALFEITAEDESMQIASGNDMSFFLDYQGEEDPFGMFSSGFVAESQQDVSNSRYYEMVGTKMEPGKENLNMKIQFTSLDAPGEKAMGGEPILEGKWEFMLNLHTIEPVRYEINKEYPVNGCAVMVKSIELTPISVQLTCDEAGARQLEKQEGVNLDQADSLHSLFINGVKYKDGTVVEEEGYQELWIRCGDGEYAKTARFSHVIDVDKVSALLVGDNKEEIELP
ncbi:MAG TPA: hypothetical protein DCZ40_13335 [Lachnospiraceae bacterium]|nr:hypothetical protein [Lachnospiraceae bacterium]